MDCNDSRQVLQHIMKLKGVEFDCDFVPKSRSRNSENKELSINWKFRMKSIGYGCGPWRDYTQGIALLPGYNKIKNARCIDSHKMLIDACESGRFNIINPESIFRNDLIPSPDSVELFWSILMDARSANLPFKEWANEIGLSDDSIKAKALWETCGTIRHELTCALREHLNEAIYAACEM